MKIILTGGGTAGHIYPIVAMAENLKRNSRVKFLYLGSRQGPEGKIARLYQIPFKGLMVGKWRAYFSFSNFWDLFKTFFGLIQAYFILIIFKPDVVFAKGGYVTFPVLFWTKCFKIPLVIHESDSVMGRANRWAAKFSQKICVGFSIEHYPEIPFAKLNFTGIPVRREFFDMKSFDHDRPILLLTGGSQGSHYLNGIFTQILPELLEKYEVYHLAGERDIVQIKQQHFANNPYYHLESYSKKMPEIMNKADLIISRAGATTFAEIAALGKPSILIPFLEAAADHQNANAKIYEQAKAAVVISQNALTASSLLSIINRLMEDENLRQLLAHHARQFAQHDSAQQIIDILFEVTHD